MMRPGFTTETHFSGAPLPLPMRVSAGFLVNGLSGKMRIQSLPPRLIKRVMATREASICRSVIHAASIAFKPYSPKAKLPPRHALPVRRPRICFRYFTFLGINIVVFSLPWISFFKFAAGELNLAHYKSLLTPLLLPRALSESLRHAWARFRLDRPSTSRRLRR